MIKTFIAFCLVIFSGIASLAQVNYGVKGGLVYSRPILSYYFPTHEDMIGLQVGGMANIRIAANLSFRPSLVMTQKGYRDKGNTDGGHFNTKKVLTFLELPFNLVYNVFISKKISAYAGLGVSASMAIAGKYSSEGVYRGTPFSYKEKYTFGEDGDADYSRWDPVWNFLAGVQWRRLSVEVNYTHGIANVNQQRYGYTAFRCFTLTGGYFFKDFRLGKKKLL